MSWIKGLFIIGIIAAVTLKSVDLIFNQIISHDDDLTLATSRAVVLRELDPNQTVELIPTDDYLRATDSLEQKPFRVAIDDNGFIRTGNEKAVEDGISILFLGGSTTETLYVSEKNRFPSVVERELRTRLSGEVSVFNGGVSGNHSIHSLVKFLAKGVPLEPEFVVLMHNINDLALLTKTSSYWEAPENRAMVKQINSNESALKSVLRGSKDFLIPNLYAYLKPRLFSSAANDEFEGMASDYAQLDIADIENSWRSSLISFIHIVRAWNATPVLMTQFNRNRLNDAMFETWFTSKGDRGMNKKEFVSLYAKFNDVVREVAVEEDVPLIDLASSVPSTSQYIYDTVHLNDEGSLLVGEIISTIFTEKIIPRHHRARAN